MNEIRIPFSGIPENEITEVDVKMAKSNRIWRYKIEPLLINDLNLKDDIHCQRVEKMQDSIKNHDKRWELIQILNTNEESEYVHILYREKNYENNIINK
jgi:hypothetical protein